MTSHSNNFDLIRLFAALQVATMHSSHYLINSESEGIFRLLLSFWSLFPGVPVFFAISGFLITKSAMRSNTYTQYAVNRILRIYPALWACLAVSIAFYLFACGIQRPQENILGFSIWVSSEVVFGHIYSSSIFSDFGTGKLNGSLWTIPIELQFYLILPFLLKSLAKARHPTILVILGAVASLVIQNATKDCNSSSTALKLLEKSLAPYFYIFSAGILLAIYENKMRKILEGKFIYWITIYLLYSYLSETYLNSSIDGTHPTLISLTLLSATLFSAAFSFTWISQKLLGGKDISYGVYIYHMPVVNLLMHYQTLEYTGFYLSITITLLIALASWTLIEQPALSNKAKIHKLVKTATLGLFKIKKLSAYNKLRP